MRSNANASTKIGPPKMRSASPRNNGDRLVASEPLRPKTPKDQDLSRTSRASEPAGDAVREGSGLKTGTGTGAGKRGQPLGDWQVWESANFQIIHQTDEARAAKIAEAAEATREAQFLRWGGREPTKPWTPLCQIFIYSSAPLFAKITGHPEDSPGFSSMSVKAGQIVKRVVHLRENESRLLDVHLPHEVTHVVLSDFFPTRAIPRWADEGMAVMSEPVAEQTQRIAELAEPIRNQRIFQLKDLTAMNYPRPEDWPVYYAQSVSVTRFLVDQGTPAKFLRFLQASQNRGMESQLREFYNIDSFDDLQKRWQSYAEHAAAPR